MRVRRLAVAGTLVAVVLLAVLAAWMRLRPVHSVLEPGVIGGRSAEEWRTHFDAAIKAQDHAIIEELAGLGSEGVVLLAWLGSEPPDEIEMRVTHRAVEGIGAPAAIELHRLLEEGSAPQRYWAVKSLGLIGEDGLRAAPAVVALLEKAIEEDDGPMRSAAEWVLGEMGPGAAPFLEEMARTPETRESALHVLRSYGLQALPVLDRLSLPEGTELAIAAVQMSAEIRTEQGAVQLYSVSAVDSADQIGQRMRRHVMAQTGMRYALARQLGIHQMTIEESLVRLREILDGDDPVQRRQAIEALKFYGPVARSLEPYLLQALDDHDPKMRRDAAIALGAMPLQADDETVGALSRQMSGDDDDLARQCALWALGEIGAPAAAAFPRVVEQLENNSWDPWGVDDRDRRRVLAAQTLARLDAEAAIPHLLPQLNEPRWFVRHGMVNALALCGPAALEPLRAELDDARPRVRDSAAVALLKMGDRLTLAYAVVADAQRRPNDDFLEWAAEEAAGQFRRPGR